MKQPERSNENLSWSKVNARRMNFDRTARIYAALAALLFVFVFSLSNATGASSPQTNQPSARQGEVVLDGIRYSPITNDKGQTIYVLTIATPEYIAKIIEDNLGLIKKEINWDLIRIYEEEPIEELTIDPNLEQRLQGYFSWVMKYRKSTPENLKELEELEKEVGDPLIVTYYNFKIREVNGKTYLVPIREDGRYGYGAAIKLKIPKEENACAIEASYIIRKTSEGIETELKTRDYGLYYDKETEEWLKEEGIDELVKTAYPMILPLKETKLEVITHLCIMRNPENPKQATLYASPPFETEYTPRAFRYRYRIE